MTGIARLWDGTRVYAYKTSWTLGTLRVGAGARRVDDQSRRTALWFERSLEAVVAAGARVADGGWGWGGWRGAVVAAHAVEAG